MYIDETSNILFVGFDFKMRNDAVDRRRMDSSYHYLLSCAVSKFQRLPDETC